MRWRREIDYHGSRAYAAEEPVRGFSLGIAGLVDLVRRKLRKLGREPSPPMVLLHDGQHTFSLLGLDSVPSRRRAAECPFPVKTDSAATAANACSNNQPSETV